MFGKSVIVRGAMPVACSVVFLQGASSLIHGSANKSIRKPLSLEDSCVDNVLAVCVSGRLVAGFFKQGIY